MNKSIKNMTVAALLTALGVIIPMFSPFKILIEPASFTLASHVPIFMAMFVSIPTAIGVTIGTTIGFFLGGFPIVVVLRAASHIVFVAIGAYYLNRHPELTLSPVRLRLYSLIIGVIHAIGEVLVVTAFYFGNRMGDVYYQQGFVKTVIVLVGIGGLIHSMVDFEIAWLITKLVSRSDEASMIFDSVRIPQKNA